MTKTGARARSLAEYISAAGLRIVPPPTSPRLEAYPSDRLQALHDLFELLGGDPAYFDQLRPGPWDLAFETDLLVELDEQQHFNRYRALTLAASWGPFLPWTTPYLAYCTEFESACLRHGKGQQRWTNPSAERFFGAAEPPGMFTAVGSPRWRQRAFYDAMKDALPGHRLARVSVHDQIEGRSMESILRTRDLAFAAPVHALILSRVSVVR